AEAGAGIFCNPGEHGSGTSGGQPRRGTSFPPVTHPPSNDWRRVFMTTIPRSGAGIRALAPAMPVVVVTDANTAGPLARALVEGGVPAIELTSRTPAALGGIEQIAAEVSGAVVGAGTVVTTEQADAAAKAGARFLV